MHNQGIISKMGYMVKYEYQQWETWTSMDQHGYIWQSVTINTEIYDQVWLQHRDTWPNVNINIGTYKQVRMSTQVYMTKCDYQYGET